MDVRELDFDLPPELIAQEPAARRDESRLLVVRRSDRSFSHHIFRELPEFLGSDWLLVRNKARVRRARLRGERPTGGAVECLLLHPAEDGHSWWCLLKPGKKLPSGATFGLEEVYTAEVQERREEQFRVRVTPAVGLTMEDVLEKAGTLPLPPYIHREADDPRAEQDAERYQTVYAEKEKAVAAAAPTAGLHFTPELIRTLQAQGNRFADVVLEVGLGTFKPIDVEQVEDYDIHREFYEVRETTRQQLLDQPVEKTLAVGTTSVRTLEDAARKGRFDTTKTTAARAEANLYLVPPAEFYRTGALITNFHLPRSTLLCLVGAFLDPGGLTGLPWLHELYAEAIRERYRFFSYGDAMLIL